jgi:hypothetical protein
MPFKSKAQRRKFAALLVEGKISPETFEEWNQETGSKKLPERVESARVPAFRNKKAASKKKSASAKKKDASRKVVSRRKVAAAKKKRRVAGGRTR